MGSRPGLRRAYAGWLAVLVVAAGLAAVALRPAQAQDDGLANPTAFAENSYQSNCAACHGPSGGGGTVPDTDLRGPALVGRDDVTAAYVDLVLRTGRMPPPGDPFDNRARQVFYDDAERQAMVTWMTETFDLTDDIPEVAEGDIARGLETFALHCAHCHGNAGAGGTAGQTAWTPRVNTLDPIAVVEAIRVGPFEMPAFSQDVLTPEEVDSIASYLTAVDEEEGTPVLGLAELNPVYASGFVGLLAVLLLGSLLFIGGRPIALQSVDVETVGPLPAPIPSEDLTVTPDDPQDPHDPDDPDDGQETV